MTVSHWIKACRPRTLPLASAGIICGSMLSGNAFLWSTFALLIFTAVLLQILSNLANDYGDFLKGADTNRKGEARMVASGSITPNQMLTGIILVAILTFFSGLGLLFTSPGTGENFYLFFLIGLLSIVAAITYTVGKKAYGYLGLGDVSVFIFFGLVSVCGSYLLMGAPFKISILLPAAAIGLLSAGVLNLNNIRDLEEDQKVGKQTLAVKLGRKTPWGISTFLLFSLLFWLFFILYLPIKVPGNFFFYWLPFPFLPG